MSNRCSTECCPPWWLSRLSGLAVRPETCPDLPGSKTYGIVLTGSGEVLTNNHVVANATQIKVTLYGEKKAYPATVLGTDPGDDVALLQLRAPRTLKAVSLDESGKIQVGEEVLAILSTPCPLFSCDRE